MEQVTLGRRQDNNSTQSPRHHHVHSSHNYVLDVYDALLRVSQAVLLKIDGRLLSVEVKVIDKIGFALKSCKSRRFFFQKSAFLCHSWPIIIIKV